MNKIIKVLQIIGNYKLFIIFYLLLSLLLSVLTILIARALSIVIDTAVIGEYNTTLLFCYIILCISVIALTFLLKMLLSVFISNLEKKIYDWGIAKIAEKKWMLLKRAPLALLLRFSTTI
jgi:ABC-type bacteriocin/lantibiotic exporter with double-glycine peptidase domain